MAQLPSRRGLKSGAQSFSSSCVPRMGLSVSVIHGEVPRGCQGIPWRGPCFGPRRHVDALSHIASRRPLTTLRGRLSSLVQRHADARAPYCQPHHPLEQKPCPGRYNCCPGLMKGYPAARLVGVACAPPAGIEIPTLVRIFSPEWIQQVIRCFTENRTAKFPRTVCPILSRKAPATINGGEPHGCSDGFGGIAQRPLRRPPERAACQIGSRPSALIPAPFPEVVLESTR